MPKNPNIFTSFEKKLLIDTQSFIWFVENNPQLSVNARSIMENEEYSLFISIASLWEIVIKSSLNKLELKKSVSEFINNVNENGFTVLPIKLQHLITLYELEYMHKDPFDRIIISQAMTENMSIISSDKYFERYPVNTIRQ
jgi:PIN domain nuclease of toxin-antitoxin system